MKRTKSKYLAIVAVLLSPMAANAVTINFFTDRAAFDASVNGTTDIGFEGICGPNAWCTPEGGDFTFNGTSTTVGGVTFSVPGGTIGVSEANAPVAGSPYNSALLFSNNNEAITADMTGVGPITALGGWFGNILQPANTTLTVVGTSGTLFQMNVAAGDMGAGNLETFYGWTVFGDSILSVTHSSSSAFGGIDDLVYGSSVSVPEPGTLALLGIGLFGMGLARRRKMI